MELDGILKAMEEGRSPGQYEPATVDRVRELVSSSAHKREPVPVFETRRRIVPAEPEREES